MLQPRRPTGSSLVVQTLGPQVMSQDSVDWSQILQVGAFFRGQMAFHLGPADEQAIKSGVLQINQGAIGKADLALKRRLGGKPQIQHGSFAVS